MNWGLSEYNAVPLGAMLDDPDGNADAYRPLPNYGSLQILPPQRVPELPCPPGAPLAAARAAQLHGRLHLLEEPGAEGRRRERLPGERLRVPADSPRVQLRRPGRRPHPRGQPLVEPPAARREARRVLAGPARQLAARRRLELLERRSPDGRLRHPGDDRRGRIHQQHVHHGVTRRLCHAGARLRPAGRRARRLPVQPRVLHGALARRERQRPPAVLQGPAVLQPRPLADEELPDRRQRSPAAAPRLGLQRLQPPDPLPGHGPQPHARLRAAACRRTPSSGSCRRTTSTGGGSSSSPPGSSSEAEPPRPCRARPQGASKSKAISPAASTVRTERRPSARFKRDASHGGSLPPRHHLSLGASGCLACCRSPPPRDRRGDDSEQRTEHDRVPDPERRAAAPARSRPTTRACSSGGYDGRAS